MTSRHIVAVFDSRDAAQNARQSLLQLGLPDEEVNIVDQGSSELRRESAEHQEGLWAHIKHMFVPDRDREALDEHIRRGGYVLSSTMDETQADAAVETLERAGAVDLDEREASRRSSGWEDSPSTQPVTSRADGSAESTDGEGVERIPVVEEHLVVGKREVNRGGVRVRSYVREEPAHADVRLRDERIEVERRPIDEPARAVQQGSADDLMRERTVDVTETDEEPVVGKDARVKEEVVVKKTSEERVQPIDDTVRRTEVNVERIEGQGDSSGQQGTPRPREEKPQPRGRA